MALRTPSRYSRRWYYEDKLEYLIDDDGTPFYIFDPVLKAPPNYLFNTEETPDGFYEILPTNHVYAEGRTLTVKLWDQEDIPIRRQDTFNNEVAWIEYEVDGHLVTITNWQHTWRDEWPIRLGFQYIRNCLYKPGQGTVFRVVKDPQAFWVSEGFLPVTGQLGEYLETTPLWVP